MKHPTEILNTIQGKLPSAKNKQMQTLDVLRHVVSREAPQANFEKFVNGLDSILKDDKNTLIQVGNTVFLVNRKMQDQVEFHTFSADHPGLLAENFRGLANFFKNQRIKSAVTYEDTPHHSELFKKTGFPVKITNTAQSMAGEANPVYRIEIVTAGAA